ncbi:MAG: hypothetical protein ACYDGU_10095, partial [Acidiferrobacterales bacterium]
AATLPAPCRPEFVSQQAIQPHSNHSAASSVLGYLTLAQRHCIYEENHCFTGLGHGDTRTVLAAEEP